MTSMPIAPSRLVRILPPTPLARSLSAQSVLFAVGEGTFLTGSAVFFTHLVGLSAAQVGLGLTLAGVVTFLVSVRLGRAADRIGPKRMWAIGALLEALLYFAWPWIHGLAEFLVIITLLELVGAAGNAGRGAYTLDAFPRKERVRTFAFMRSALNIGFTFGALFGGLALASGSNTVIRLVPILTSSILLLNSWLISRLPAAAHDRRAAADVAKAEQVELHGKQGARRAPSVLRNRGFLAANVCQGVLATHQVLLNVVIPLWLVQETDAPRVLLAYLFGTNTVLAVLLQVPASRGADTIRGALRAAWVGSGFFVLSCLIVMLTHQTVGALTIGLVWLGHVTVTGAELFQSASNWGLTAELSDPQRRGEYQGAARVGFTVGSVWAPAAFTYLTMSWGAPGWLTIAAIIVLASIALPPTTLAAERYLTQVQPTGDVAAPQI